MVGKSERRRRKSGEKRSGKKLKSTMFVRKPVLLHFLLVQHYVNTSSDPNRGSVLSTCAPPPLLLFGLPPTGSLLSCAQDTIHAEEIALRMLDDSKQGCYSVFPGTKHSRGDKDAR